MGLDTYAARFPGEIDLNPADQQAFIDAEIELCGGICSGEGGSFRGKIYIMLVSEITGVSLYQEWIPPGTVEEMYRKLAACDPAEAMRLTDTWDMTVQDIIELRKFFKVCVELGLGLVNWW